MKRLLSLADFQENSFVNATFTMSARTQWKKQITNQILIFLLSKCQLFLTNLEVQIRSSLQIGKASVSLSMNTTADSRVSRICATFRWTEFEKSNPYRSIEPNHIKIHFKVHEIRLLDPNIPRRRLRHLIQRCLTKLLLINQQPSITWTFIPPGLRTESNCKLLFARKEFCICLKPGTPHHYPKVPLPSDGID